MRRYVRKPLDLATLAANPRAIRELFGFGQPHEVNRVSELLGEIKELMSDQQLLNAGRRKKPHPLPS